MRLTFTVRVGLAIVLGVTIVWLGTVVHFYLSQSSGPRNTRPLPGQVAALVTLLEHSTPAERPLLLRAVTSQAITARVEPGTHVGVTPSLQRVPRLTARAVDRYLAAAGGRPNSVTVSGERGVLSRFSFVTPVDLELRVGLTTGETLVVDAMSYPVANIFGLPVGFVTGLTSAVIGLIALFALQREATLSRRQVRMASLVRGRIAMLGGISHDVRTFLTRLRLRVDRIPDEQERERAIADISAMNRLLDDAVLAGRAGAGELTEELIDFIQVVRAEVEDRQAAGKPVDLRVGAVPTAVVLGDRLALRRIVANIIDNALIYGKAAHLSLDTTAGQVTLTVDDEGPGIPPEQRESILEPFVRLEDSRNRQTGGAGLGLAVTRSLVEAHSGTISISDAPNGGARVTVRLELFVAR